MKAIDTDLLVRSRLSLHGAAEMLLAGPQYEASGDIRLRCTPRGFGTVAEPDLRVDGDELVAGSTRVRLSDRTYAGVAAAAGIAPRRLDDVYHDGPGLDVMERVEVDRRSALLLAEAFDAGDSALRSLAPDEEPVLWPEHFDIGIRVGETNYGVSAGDGFLPAPYAYVGPTKPQVGEFWNAPFGAARPVSQLRSAAGVLAFFREGRSLLE